MVTIADYQRRKNAEGKEFFTLTLLGGVELVRSSISGNYYATAWRASITCTFNEEMCKTLIGKTLPGTVERVESEPYEYKVPSTGETIMLTHKYRFTPHPSSPTMEEAVFTPVAVTS